jgi:hypothetical protein
MKTFWKWILGIVIVLVVLAGLGIGTRLLMVNYLPEARLGFGDLDGFHGQMMRGRGFGLIGGMMPFGGGFHMLGGFFPLLLLGLLFYGVYRLGRHGSLAHNGGTPSPAVVKTCTKCGHQVQETWNNCPNCGKKL